MTPFLVIWTGQAFSLVGTNLVHFALVWYLTESTGSATALAMASLVALLPQILIGPFAGALVVRWNRRAVMLIADSMIALATVILAALFALNTAETWHIYLLLFVRALGGAFHWPAMLASTSLMVPARHLSRVGGMNQALFGAANSIVPPLGALLLELLPIEAILSVDVGTALVAIVSLAFVAIPQPEPSVVTVDASADDRTTHTVWDDMLSGLRFLWQWPGMLMLVSIGMLIRATVGPGIALLPILARDHFGGRALQFAWLQTAGGIGTVVGGVLLSVWGGFRRRIVTAMVALALDGVAILAMGLVPPNRLWLAVAALFVAGVVEPSVLGSLGAIAQATIPPGMQGRVFSLSSAGGSILAPLGLALAGPVSDALGAQVWFLFGGIATMAMGVGAFFVPALMCVEDGPPERRQDGPVPIV